MLVRHFPGQAPTFPFPPRYSRGEKSQDLAQGGQKRAWVVAQQPAPRGPLASFPPRERDPTARPPTPPLRRAPVPNRCAPCSPGRSGDFSDAARQETRINNPRVLKGAARWFYCTVKTSPRKTHRTSIHGFIYVCFLYVHPKKKKKSALLPPQILGTLLDRAAEM